MTNFLAVPKHAAFVGSLMLCLLALTTRAQETDPITIITTQAEPEVIQTMDSPDGSLHAEVVVYPCVDVDGQLMSYERLELTNGDENTRIAEQLINCGGLGTFGLWVKYWTESGDYLYYTDGREGQPDGGLPVFWAPTLWRVHLTDMQTESLSQAQFSPDRSQLVTYHQGLFQIIPIDSDEGVTFEQVPSGLQITNIIWLPDNSGLLYIQADVLYGPASRSTVTHIDLQKSTQTVIIDNEN